MSAQCGCCGQFYDVVEENFEGGWDALKVAFPLFVTTLFWHPYPDRSQSLLHFMSQEYDEYHSQAGLTNPYHE